MTISCWTTFKKDYRKYLAALELGSCLVKNDTEWVAKLGATAESDSSEDDNSGSGSAGYPKNADEESVKPPTPLILATKFGCMEIALQIIKEHPQTVEQIDEEYGSILHLAIKYRRIDIFDEVEKMEMQMRSLVRLQDKDENSILHMVALNTAKVKDEKTPFCICIDATSSKKLKDKPLNPWDAEEFEHKSSKKLKDKPLNPWDAEEFEHKTRSPAFELQDDLLLFERVENIVKTHYPKRPNKDLQAADQLFSARKESLREAAQEWMKSTAQNCTVNAILIATVAFAAAYTLCCVFVNPDFTIPISRLQEVTFKKANVWNLMYIILLDNDDIGICSNNHPYNQGTRIALYAVAFLPASILAATYLPIYYPLVRKSHHPVHKLKIMTPARNGGARLPV